MQLHYVVTSEDFLYSILKSNPWETYFQKSREEPIEKNHLNSESVKIALNNGYLVKIFQKLRKDAKGWTEDINVAKELMLDLLYEYSLPKPMPEDEFYNFHVDTNQAYLMLATAGTGTLIAEQLKVFRNIQGILKGTSKAMNFSFNYFSKEL